MALPTTRSPTLPTSAAAPSSRTSGLHVPLPTQSLPWTSPTHLKPHALLIKPTIFPMVVKGITSFQHKPKPQSPPHLLSYCCTPRPTPWEVLQLPLLPPAPRACATLISCLDYCSSQKWSLSRLLFLNSIRHRLTLLEQKPALSLLKASSSLLSHTD